MSNQARMVSKYSIIEHLSIPVEVMNNWQETTDLIAEIINVPAALIMRVHPHEIEVFVKSNNKKNVYKSGERATLDTGLYCETVMDTHQELLVPDALNDPLWEHNPDIELGMISYYGLPLTWPTGEIFGTLCILDSKKNKHSNKYRKLMKRFRDTIQLSITSVYEASQKNTEITQSKEQIRILSQAVEQSPLSIVITDSNAKITYINPAFEKITGYHAKEVIGQNPKILQSGETSKKTYVELWSAISSKKAWEGDIQNRRKNGELYWEHAHIAPVVDSKGKIVNYLAIKEDVTRKKEYQQQLEYIAHFDALTNLPNRVLLSKRLQHSMSHVQCHSQLLAVVYLDLDGFKDINDNYGHDIGDQLLVILAKRLNNTLRDKDTFARIGGDEFVAVLSELSDKNDYVQFLERLLSIASKPVHIDKIELQVSASLGVTFFPQKETIDADQLLRQADQAMYQAKLSGKNQFHIFDTVQDTNIRGHHESLERIRQAFENKEFVLYYQPKVNMRTGDIIGAEVLIRWQHPELGLLSPVEFLPVIENNSLLIELGDWVISNALTQLEAWHEIGLKKSISVNISALQVQQSDFISKLNSNLQQHSGVESHFLELEILETSALADITYVSNIIDECKKIGVKFALDDFGTGYSSLTYLKRLPASTLKIDRSFVRDMLNDPEDLAILEGILGLSSAFQREVIAEGVETVEHGELLLQLGCEFAQGFGIARPMPADEFPEWVASWQPDLRWKQVQEINKDDYTLLYAGIEHRAWVRAIEDYNDSKSVMLPPLSTNECRFGQWFKGKGKERYGGLKSYQSILPLHEKIHQLGEELCNLQRQKIEPQSKLMELHKIQDMMLNQLKNLLHERQG
ncbi:MAG: EAL domain-containing protein [Gammaproteobacteria bacterium]|nr:EAL domain-containing protein [Gammaproteobacteria bacterium]